MTLAPQKNQFLGLIQFGFLSSLQLYPDVKILLARQIKT